MFTKHFIVPPKELSSRFFALSRVDHKSLTVLTPVADLYLSQSPLSRSLAPLSRSLAGSMATVLSCALANSSWRIQLSAMSEVPLEGAMTQLGEVRWVGWGGEFCVLAMIDVRCVSIMKSTLVYLFVQSLLFVLITAIICCRLSCRSSRSWSWSWSCFVFCNEVW